MGMPALDLKVRGEISLKGVSYEETIEAERTSVPEAARTRTLLTSISEYCSQYFLVSLTAVQSSETCLAQTVSILLSHCRQLSLVDFVRGAPTSLSGLTEKRRSAFSTLFLDAHAQQSN